MPVRVITGASYRHFRSITVQTFELTPNTGKCPRPARQYDRVFQTVYHWSRIPNLRETDPAYAGTGTRGAERDRPQVKGTYFGEPGYREPAVQCGIRYTAQLDYTTVYDLESDPLCLILTAQRSARGSGNGARYEFEQLVLHNGFLGYRAENVVKYFRPVTVIPAF